MVIRAMDQAAIITRLEMLRAGWVIKKEKLMKLLVRVEEWWLPITLNRRILNTNRIPLVLHLLQLLAQEHPSNNNSNKEEKKPKLTLIPLPHQVLSFIEMAVGYHNPVMRKRRFRPRMIVYRVIKDEKKKTPGVGIGCRGGSVRMLFSFCIS
jgi:hypothetical protein